MTSYVTPELLKKMLPARDRLRAVDEEKSMAAVSTRLLPDYQRTWTDDALFSVLEKVQERTGRRQRKGSRDGSRCQTDQDRG